MQYRPDIDGLRAIAVLSVVVFHLGFTGVAGGYIGVDVFFVISGFLITSIIQTKFDNSNFILTDFYFRRIRRLLPPLIATVAATLIATSFILTPNEMTQFAKSAVATLFSVSNFIFYFEAGYWDTASELKPLLHTWSLGVEEQFYLFWPAIILFFLSIRHIVGFGLSLTIISIAGVALCVWYTTIDQSAAFYLLPFRVFQFSLGALVIVLSRIKLLPNITQNVLFKECAFIIGLSLIIGSVLTFNDGTSFPGSSVLLPTVGTMLVLLAGSWPGRHGSLGTLVLENPFSIWIGRASYSMYLVHWPLISLYRYERGLELKLEDQIILGIGTLLATIILHYGVERKFYQRVKISESQTNIISGSGFALRTFATISVIAAISATAWLGDGWAWRFPQLQLSPRQILAGSQARFSRLKTGCQIQRYHNPTFCNPELPIQLLVFGNSHEPDGYNLISAAYGNDKDLNIIAFGTLNNCDNLQRVKGGFTSTDEDCQMRLNRLLSKEFISNIDILLYSANRPFSQNKAKTYQILRWLTILNPSMKVITLGGYINTNKPCSRLINETKSTDACSMPENVNYFASIPAQQPYFEEIMELTDYFIDRVDLLCEKRVLQNCLTRTPNGDPVFYDEHHHSIEFAEMTGKLYAESHPTLIRDLNKPG